MLIMQMFNYVETRYRVVYLARVYIHARKII